MAACAVCDKQAKPCLEVVHVARRKQWNPRNGGRICVFIWRGHHSFLCFRVSVACYCSADVFTRSKCADLNVESDLWVKSSVRLSWACFSRLLRALWLRRDCRWTGTGCFSDEHVFARTWPAQVVWRSKWNLKLFSFSNGAMQQPPNCVASGVSSSQVALRSIVFTRVYVTRHTPTTGMLVARNTRRSIRLAQHVEIKCRVNRGCMGFTQLQCYSFKNFMSLEIKCQVTPPHDAQLSMSLVRLVHGCTQKILWSGLFCSPSGCAAARGAPNSQLRIEKSVVCTVRKAPVVAWNCLFLVIKGSHQWDRGVVRFVEIDEHFTGPAQRVVNLSCTEVQNWLRCRILSAKRHLLDQFGNDATKSRTDQGSLEILNGVVRTACCCEARSNSTSCGVCTFCIWGIKGARILAEKSNFRIGPRRCQICAVCLQ